MSSEILINITPMETRVALVENGVLQEVSVEREKNRGIVGNIYKGKVVRVLPGMQAAFVDIGLEKAGFLHVDDLREIESGTDTGLDIRTYLREGQSIVVQVIKDPISTKGVRLSTKLSVSSRYLVYMPYEEHIGISQRIEDESERLRLREQLDKAIENVGRIEGAESIESSEAEGGYILRTAAEGVDSEELAGEIGFLQQLWGHVSETAKMVEAPALVYKDLPMFLRVLRDMANPQIEKVKVDSQKNYQKLCEFSRRFNPEMLSILEYYSSDRPLFYLHGVEDEISKALEKTVPLKSGGSLVIEQTEAMTTVDVNTGAFVGRRNLEETTYKTNLEAASTIARQLRLRNLGGIIIIDFIDMKDTEHRRQVMRALEKALSRDRAKTTIASVSALGLVEMTRKRSSESLGRTLCQPCPACEGKGRL
jgi:ribonuclease G